MPHAALIVMWWYMATAIPKSEWSSNSPRPVAQAIGPFPTEAMCLASLRQVAPSDRRYWSDAHKAKWKAYDAQVSLISQVEDKRINLLDRLLKANQKLGIYSLPDGAQIKVWTIATAKDWDSIVRANVLTEQQKNELHCTVIKEGDGSYLPKLPDLMAEPESLQDTYIINNGCEAVNGWYKEIN